jgi:protein arginine N-methyltransferase 1
VDRASRPSISPLFHCFYSAYTAANSRIAVIRGKAVLTGIKLSYQAEQIWSPISETILSWEEAFHDLLLNDRLRMNAYRKAIFEVVKPGDHVVDLGVGTGILSEWALDAGAARVTGIEMSKEILDRALDRLTKARHRDRFFPVNKVSFDVDLDAPADVLISEIMGNMADNENFQPILQDAIRRFLKPNGRILPKSVSSYIAPVSAMSAHRDLCQGNISSLSASYGVGNINRNSKSLFDLYYDCVLPEQLYLDDPQMVCRYEGQWTQSPTYERQISYTLRRDGTLTGFKAYFIAELSDETILDISGGNIAAGETSDSWKHAHLPIEKPIDVRQGDILSLTFSRRYPETPASAFQQIYQWCGAVRRHGAIVGEFAQRTG